MDLSVAIHVQTLTGQKCGRLVAVSEIAELQLHGRLSKEEEKDLTLEKGPGS